MSNKEKQSLFAKFHSVLYTELSTFRFIAIIEFTKKTHRKNQMNRKLDNSKKKLHKMKKAPHTKTSLLDLCKNCRFLDSHTVWIQLHNIGHRFTYAIFFLVHFLVLMAKCSIPSSIWTNERWPFSVHLWTAIILLCSLVFQVKTHQFCKCFWFDINWKCHTLSQLLQLDLISL